MITVRFLEGIATFIEIARKTSLVKGNDSFQRYLLKKPFFRGSFTDFVQTSLSLAFFSKVTDYCLHSFQWLFCDLVHTLLLSRGKLVYCFLEGIAIFREYFQITFSRRCRYF